MYNLKFFRQPVLPEGNGPVLVPPEEKIKENFNIIYNLKLKRSIL